MHYIPHWNTLPLKLHDLHSYALIYLVSPIVLWPVIAVWLEMPAHFQMWSTSANNLYIFLSGTINSTLWTKGGNQKLRGNFYSKSVLHMIANLEKLEKSVLLGSTHSQHFHRLHSL